eukprot:TRINITY_DN11254_c1_g1_i1.p3 TRINITY_DN11254_c1_g1~~TRINITY_DN11254_c1_g1_i1.p3  ORF type:complete len:114 (+),score=65.99 TRINITY_DN11254_c1_g1_i1:165-506(+)
MFASLVRASALRTNVAARFFCSAAESNKIFVGSVSWSTTEDGLAEAFSQFGNVTEVRIVKDRDTGRSRGFAFITFSSPDDAANAIVNMNERELNGRKIFVNAAKAQEPRRNDY